MKELQIIKTECLLASIQYQFFLNLNFSIAHSIFNLDKLYKDFEKKKIINNKQREESMMEVEGNEEAQRNTIASNNRSGNASMVREEFNPEQMQSRTQQLKEKLMKYKQGKKAQVVQMPTFTPDCETKDISQVILTHFSNELRPKILSKYPTAPDDKINKVILQKWNTLEQAKKDAYTRATLKKIQSAKQAKKQQEQQTQIYGEQEEVLVKQQAPQPQHEPEPIEQKIEAKQNRFGDFLNRIKKNIKGMEEENQKNKVFKEENENENVDEGDGQERIEEQRKAMEEEKQVNEEAQEKHQQEYQEQGRSVNNQQQQQQSQTDEMQQQK